MSRASGTVAVPILAATVVAVALVVFRPTPGLVVFGIANGGLYGLAAVGVVLVYRVHGALNFAAVAMGALPGATAMLLLVVRGTSYPATLGLAVLGGVGVAALVEVVVIRRFADGSRLLFTIATIAVVQVIAVVNERVAAVALSDEAVPAVVPSPWRDVAWSDSHGIPLLTGDQLAAAIVVVLAAAAVGCWLRFSRSGIAVRAIGENGERAQALGIPISGLRTSVWAVAGALAGIAVFFRIPLVGVPVDPTLGVDVTVAVLGAAALARFTSVPLALLAGVGLGVIEQAALAWAGSAGLASLVVFGVLVLGMFARSEAVRRAPDAEELAWMAASESRTAARHDAAWGRGRRNGVLAIVMTASVALAAPFVVSAGTVGKLSLIALTAILGLSVVVLTGWSGFTSLGQLALAAVGAGVAGGLAVNHDADFVVAVLGGTAAAAVATLIIGIPAGRIRGLRFAIVTLALAVTMERYVLQPGRPVHEWVLPHGDAPRVVRPVLFGWIDLGDERAFYFLCVAALLGAFTTTRWFRQGRTGRVVVASRDNAFAAQTFAINQTAARIVAFTFAGALAGLGGALLAYHQGNIDPGTFGPAPSVQLFLAVVLGGVASPLGAVLGTLVLGAVQLFVEPIFRDASVLFDGPLLLAVLLVNPGGIGGVLANRRDRAVASRRPAGAGA